MPGRDRDWRSSKSVSLGVYYPVSHRLGALMKRHFLPIVIAGALCASLLPLMTVRAQAPQGKKGGTQSAGTESGFAVFQQRCMTCHGNPNVERAPSPAAIREMS